MPTRPDSSRPLGRACLLVSGCLCALPAHQPDVQPAELHAALPETPRVSGLVKGVKAWPLPWLRPCVSELVEGLHASCLHPCAMTETLHVSGPVTGCAGVASAPCALVETLRVLRLVEDLQARCPRPQHDLLLPRLESPSVVPLRLSKVASSPCPCFSQRDPPHQM